MRAQLAKLMMGDSARVTLASLRLRDDDRRAGASSSMLSGIEHEGAVARLLVHVRDTTDERSRELRSRTPSGCRRWARSPAASPTTSTT